MAGASEGFFGRVVGLLLLLLLLVFGDAVGAADGGGGFATGLLGFGLGSTDCGFKVLSRSLSRVESMREPPRNIDVNLRKIVKHD